MDFLELLGLPFWKVVLGEVAERRMGVLGRVVVLPRLVVDVLGLE